MVNITLIGGGNSTHSLIPLLSNAGHIINLLTRNPDKWSKEIKMEYISQEGKIINQLTGKLNLASDDPQDVIPQADVIILSLPVSKYRIVLNRIASFINKSKKIDIGTMYGQGGFNWMVEEIKKKYNLTNIVIFASGLLPWITRTKEYGKIGYNYGPKSMNVVAVHPKSEFKRIIMQYLDDICYRWFKTGKYHLSDNFISLTLSVDNQVIHLSRLYGLYEKFGGKWKNRNDIPLFYKDYDDNSAELLKSLDSDYNKIRIKIKKLYSNKDFKYMLDYLSLERLSYNSTNENIKESFINSKTLGQIYPPTVKTEDGCYVFDKNHRFFNDDLYYGLLIAKWFAEKLEINTKTLDKIINWAQMFIGDEILLNNKIRTDLKLDSEPYKFGFPEIYGFKSIDEVID